MAVPLRLSPLSRARRGRHPAGGPLVVPNGLVLYLALSLGVLACGNDAVAPRQPNENPTAELDVPEAARTGEEILLDGSTSSDPDGFLAEFRFRVSDTGQEWITAETAIPYVFSEPGTYTVTLTVVDNRGGSDAVSAGIEVTGSSLGGDGSPDAGEVGDAGADAGLGGSD
jgi:hypothetical protein